MSVVPKSWIDALFSRLSDIYQERYSDIDKTFDNWAMGLNGMSGEQIKHALALCRADREILPSPMLFRTLCLSYGFISDNNNSDCSQLKAQGEEIKSNGVIPLVLPFKAESSYNPLNLPVVKDPDWKDKLLAMDEIQALGLSVSERYDRTRLLMEKQGREQVRRLQTVTDLKPKPEIKRKDWKS
jgi:hypothetical protein